MKKYKPITGILFCIIFTTFSCKKDKDVYLTEYPYLVSREISNIDAGGITATAEILSLGLDSIVDYGFVWSSTGAPTIENSRLSVGSQPHVGTFSSRINNCINENVLYNIRPYIKSKRFLVYGDEMQFIGLGSFDPVISDFMPKTGKRESAVTIVGNYFNSNATIYFGNVKAKVIKANLNEIVVEVPSAIGKVNINLLQNDKIFKSNQTYNILYPWTEIPIPAELLLIEFPASFVLNNKGYFVGGHIKPYGACSNKMWEFNPLNNQWVQKSAFPGTPRENAVSFVINDKAYLCFGENDLIDPFQFSDLWEYDPSSDSWSRKADFTLQEYGLPVSFSDNSKGYIGLGLEQYYYGSGEVSSKFWSYDPINNNWEQLTNFPVKTFLSTAFHINNKSYAGLGIGNNYSFYEYNPLSNSWILGFSYPGIGDWNAKNFVIEDKLYIGFGNHDNSNNYTEFWEFNHTTNLWKRLIDFPYSTWVTNSFSINKKGYIFENRYDRTNGKFTTYFWEFDPEKN
jgi:N-acetylneuraminic acid mutarotase